MSTLAITDVFQNSTPAQWLYEALQDAQNLGLPSTAWQPGDPLRTLLQIFSLQFAKDDAQISGQGQGGLLDFASQGSITFTDIDGSAYTIAVTPDPSVPGQNPSATPGFLDFLVASNYGISRIAGSAASGSLYLVNITASSLGTFGAGGFHFANAGTGATFSNSVGFTYSSSPSISVSAVSPVSPVTVTTSAPHGLATGAVVAVYNIPGLVGLLGAATTPSGKPIGFCTVTVTGSSTLVLNGVTSTGALYSSGGAIYTPQAITDQADIVGTQGNSAPGQLSAQITSAPGGYFVNMTSQAGTNYQSNSALVALARAKLGLLSPNGAPGGYVAYAYLANLILGGQAIDTAGLILPSPLPTTITLDGGAITQAIAVENTVTGITTVILANSTGPVEGIINLGISNVAPGTPVAITTSAPHGLASGDYVQINNVVGPTAINNQWQITSTGSSSFTLNGSSDATAWVSGGTVSGGDLYAVDLVLRTYARPNGSLLATVSCISVAITPTATIYVPAAFVSDYKTKVQIALTAYLGNLKIGGLNVDGATNILPISAIEGVLFAAGQNNGQIYTLSVSNLLLNGSNADVSLGTTGFATLGSGALAALLAGVTGI